MVGRVLVAAGAAALACAPALAQNPAGVTIALTPNTPAAATIVAVSVDGTQLDPSAQRAAKGFQLLVQRGFEFDRRAVAELCTAGHDCPAASKVGSGQAVITATTPFGATDATADITAFLAPPAQAGDLAGVVLDIRVPQFGIQTTATARVLRAAAPYGLELRADDVSGGQQLPPGVTARLKSLSLTTGASRKATVTTTKRKRVKRGKRVRYKRVKVRRTVTYALITTPKECTGSWTAHAIVTFQDGGPPLEQDVTAACSAG